MFTGFVAMMEGFLKWDYLHSLKPVMMWTFLFLFCLPVCSSPSLTCLYLELGGALGSSRAHLLSIWLITSPAMDKRRWEKTLMVLDCLCCVCCLHLIPVVPLFLLCSGPGCLLPTLPYARLVCLFL
ncbi:hypothetical protein NQD34_018401 [Periophthalmus magnuspinnatus]|nr:hypothetical protein NQD34_018401 [Periophthalmus magnuspinnatus]